MLQGRLIPALNMNIGGAQMRFLREEAHEIPVIREVDVVVCGAGPARIGAALAAKGGMSPRELDVLELRKTLREQDCVV